MKHHIFHIALVLATWAWAANGIAQDSRVMDYTTFMELVKANHPLALQAGLQRVKGDAYVLKARGAFDPKAFLDASQKQFDDKDYYQLLDGGLKVPTWFGIQLYSGYERNDGLFLNPENNSANDGLWYAGISLPVGQGLFIDQRRADLRQAQIYRESTEAQRLAMVNELLYNAGRVYWDWFQQYEVLLVYEEALRVAQQRFEAVKTSAVLGDRPFIDTLEAGIQVQNRRLALQQSRLDFRNASAQLSAFLWAEGAVPVEVSDNTFPQRIELQPLPVGSSFYFQLDSLVETHPELLQSRYKVDGMEVEQRWKREQLKPELNLKYNALSEPLNGDVFAAYSPNNFTWGLEFNMPLLLRKERAELRMTNIEIDQAELGIQNKRQMLRFKARASLNDWEITGQQITLYRKTVQDYNGLLEGERQLFVTGESSLFLVNRRELGYINAQLKLIELVSKNRKAELTAQYAFGQLSQ